MKVDSGPDFLSDPCRLDKGGGTLYMGTGSERGGSLNKMHPQHQPGADTLDAEDTTKPPRLPSSPFLSSLPLVHTRALSLPLTHAHAYARIHTRTHTRPQPLPVCDATAPLAQVREEEERAKADLELAKRDPWWAQHLADKSAMLERSGNPSSSSSGKRRKRKKKLPRSRLLPRAPTSRSLCRLWSTGLLDAVGDGFSCSVSVLYIPAAFKVGWKTDFFDWCTPVLPVSGWKVDHSLKESDNFPWWQFSESHVNAMLDFQSGQFSWTQCAMSSTWCAQCLPRPTVRTACWTRGSGHREVLWTRKSSKKRK